MNARAEEHGSEHLDLVCLYALRALSASEAAMVEACISKCSECQTEMAKLRPIVDVFASWPTDVLRPTTPLWDRLAERIAKETGAPPLPAPAQQVNTTEWEAVAPGIFVKILAVDHHMDRVSMLVRLEPGTDYPPHRHAGVEELYLLHGELIVNENRLSPGDFLHAEGGSSDHRVWSENGCTCLLLTSNKDVIF